LQVFEQADLPTLWLPPGVWRGWLAERLTGEESTAAHTVLAAFWRAVYEKDREGELRVTVGDGLQACRIHAKHAGNRELQLWASLRLAQRWERISEWRAARAVLEEISEADLDDPAWHLLASIDVNEGNYLAAREKFGKSLAIQQQIGNRQGEAATWHQLATIDLNEGNYPAAREKFGKALAMRQQIGDRQGEAATWHNLASIDLNEGNYPAAREKFGKALAMRQQIGDRQGEAATFYQLGFVAAEEGRLLPAAKLVGVCFLIDRAIGHGDTEQDLRSFLGLCEQLKLAEPEVLALLKETTMAYQRDRGWSLLKEAFPDWPSPQGQAED
jgi:tetratricopeptide (TPR) repeat protein